MLALAAACDALPARASGPLPELTGRVVDNAALLLPTQEAALTTQLEALEREVGPQLVIVTVPDLAGRTIEEFGVQLGRKWEIGSAARDDGVLLIVAPNAPAARIEVGYGLEYSLSDAFCAKLLRERMIPKFARGEFAEGIAAGSDAIDDKLRTVAAAERLAA